MGHGLPRQLLIGALYKHYERRQRQLRAQRRAVNEDESGAEDGILMTFPDLCMRWILYELALLFLIVSLAALHVAMQPPFAPGDYPPIFHCARALVLFIISSATAVALGYIYHPDWQAEDMTRDTQTVHCTKINVFVKGVAVSSTGLNGRRPGIVLKLPAGSSARRGIEQLRKMHLIADLNKIKPAVYTFASGVCTKLLVDKQEQEAVQLENNCTLHVRYCLPGGAPSDSGASSSRQHRRYDPIGFQPRHKFRSQDPRFWRVISFDKWHCTACDKEIGTRSVTTHESSEAHKRAVLHKYTTAGAKAMDPIQITDSARETAEPHAREELKRAVHESLQRLLLDRSREAQTGGWEVDQGRGTMDIDWTANTLLGEGSTYVPHDEQEVGSLAADLLAHLERDSVDATDEPPDLVQDSDDEEDERDEPDEGEVEDEDEDDEEEDNEDEGVAHSAGSDSMHIPSATSSAGRRHRRVFEDTNNPWYPWPDKETCIVDILRHVPRCAFSTKQNQVIHWAMSVLGIHDVPTERTMKDVDKKLQSICGVQSLRFVSAFSNIYYTNDIAAMIAQEIANPRVRRHLHFLPEKTSGSISEAWQAARWLDELDPAFLTQCIRKKDDKTQDFFVYEPALLKSRHVFMPTRWFVEGDSTYAKGWYMSLDPRHRGWIVEEHTQAVVSEDDLDLSFPLFHERCALYQVPSPRSIIGSRCESGPGAPIVQWTRTDPQAGNKWRQRAKGHRVVAFPLWLYCDDTSGNTSKKWNKHNSFLFTAAGLPRRLVHREYNIHFVSTSNVASPLEMAEGIVAQIQQAQEHGLWAWDEQEKDYVLVIPSVFALLGDNPMQSELCCHSGLAANHFCRICWVEGSDMDDDNNHTTAPDGGDTSLPLSRESTPGPESSIGSTTSGAKTRKTETLEEATARIGFFMSISERIRTKAETLNVLMEQFAHARRVGGKTAMNNKRTETGIRDSYQGRFLDMLTDLTTKKSRTKVQKTADVSALLARLPTPPDLINPLFKLSELDAHADSPVEILHVILLGIVKYFWRDIISRLKAPEKDILKARLNSFDTSALNIPPLSGETLVTYAGSLVGRDFRAIAQVAPFVLHDLGLDDNIIRVWMALSKVVPLVWQPEIDDMEQYLPRLSRAIKYLLDCTCQFDAQWFNKPKFHMLVHLPEHIRRFGPAMLFATEGFESFNAIIRARSIHSNRHAPSRDIARSMAQSNRIRHLVSGGFFRVPRDPHLSATESSTPPSRRFISPWMEDVRPDFPKAHWRAIGQQPTNVISAGSFTNRFLGFVDEDGGNGIAGRYKDIGKPKRWERTEMFKHAHEAQGSVPSYAREQAIYTPQTIRLSSAKYKRGEWVLTSALSSAEVPRLARIMEIVHHRSHPDNILVQEYIIGGAHSYYEMPTTRPSSSFRIIHGEDILCHACVVHNCKDNHCVISSSHVIRQESEHTEQRAKRVVHHNVDDLILNTGQMRSSTVMSKLSVPPPSMDRQSVILDAARKLLEKKKRKKAQPPSGPTPPQPPPPPSGRTPISPVPSTTYSCGESLRASFVQGSPSPHSVVPPSQTPSILQPRTLPHSDRVMRSEATGTAGWISGHQAPPTVANPCPSTSQYPPNLVDADPTQTQYTPAMHYHFPHLNQYHNPNVYSRASTPRAPYSHYYSSESHHTHPNSNLRFSS